MLANRSPKTSGLRAGFTLIELLVVIALIGILAGLLVPAVVGRGMRRVRLASVRMEISQLESAIARFRGNYNMDPPSSITLYENPANNNGWTSVSPSPLAIESRALIRQLWPQFNFAAIRDINGNGDPDDLPITLSQGECLVFFLGGINGNAVPDPNAVPPVVLTLTSDNNNPDKHIGACTGFSKNLANPFARGGYREAPLFEFLPARFSDVDADGFPEYFDPLPNQTMPYLYYSSYDGQGYRDTVAPFEFDTTASGSAGLSAAYRQGTAATAPRWKANSFQIISPGYDRPYGYGGTYLPTGSDGLPLPLCDAIGSTPAPTQKQRDYESDNITNFSQGELQPL